MSSTSLIQTYPGLVVARAGDVGLILWHGEPTLAANRWLIQYVTTARRAGSGFKIGIQLICDATPLPEADARRYVQEAFREELPHVRRFINAPLGDSMRQSLVRTILRGMAMIADRSKVVVIASTIREALDLTVPVASEDTPPRAVLDRLVDDLFAEARTPRPSER